jgi:hypothetical protein
LFASISAGICALWGPLHGGANEEVLSMLQAIKDDGSGPSKFIDLAKKKDSGFKLMGFGHRVYKNYDPRAKIIKEQCDKLLNVLHISDPLLDIAKRLEEAALPTNSGKRWPDMPEHMRSASLGKATDLVANQQDTNNDVDVSATNRNRATALDIFARASCSGASPRNLNALLDNGQDRGNGSTQRSEATENSPLEADRSVASLLCVILF